MTCPDLPPSKKCSAKLTSKTLKKSVSGDFRAPCIFERPSADQTRQGPSFVGKKAVILLAAREQNDRNLRARGSWKGRYMWGAAHGQTVNEPSPLNPLPFHLDRSSREPRRRSAEVGRLRWAVRRRPFGCLYRVFSKHSTWNENS